MTPRTQGRSIHLIIVFLISSITQEHPTKKHVAWCLESPEQSFCVLCMELEHITLLAHKCVHQQASPLNWKSRVFIGISFYHLNTRSDQIRSDQSLSCVRLFATPWITARQASLSITNSQSSLRLTPIESVMPSSHLVLCPPLLLLPPIPPSIRVFSNESTLRMRWPKYWSFSFSIIPSNEHPGLIFFRMDWLHLLAVQGTLKSLLQHHSSKAIQDNYCQS